MSQAAKSPTTFRKRSPPMAAGQRYGRLVAIAFVSRNKKHLAYWKFQCDCGREHVARASHVTFGNVASCGCLARELKSARTKGPPVMPGERQGRLTAVEFAGRFLIGKQPYDCWKFRCDCGTIVTVRPAYVRDGNTKSCGCLKEEALRLGQQSRKHGLSQIPEYSVWNRMVRRCVNQRDLNYPGWGGRGIKVCDRWRKFENFYADMGPRPSAKHSIDRIDNDGPYSPENCRWATRKEQANNRGNCITMLYEGRSIPLREVEALSGIKYQTLYARLRKAS